MENEINEHFDVIIQVGDSKYPCNRKALAEHSPYFQAMFYSNFIEKNKKLVELKDVDPDAVAVLLDSVLKRKIDVLKANNILSVLQASCMLQFESVQKKCLEVIIHQKLSIASCLQTMVIAHKLDLNDLYRKARAYALWEFTVVWKTDAFLELSVLDLEAYLKNNGLHITAGEFEVFEAGLHWLQYKLSERKTYVDLILKCVRFCDIQISDIKTMLLYPLIKDNENSVLLLKCIENFKYDGSCGNIAVEAKEESTACQEEKKQCKCSGEIQNILNNCCGCPRSIGETVSPVETSSVGDIQSFTVEMMELAKQLLQVPRRVLPLFPCVVGHKKEYKDGNTKDNMNIIHKPYLIYYKEEGCEGQPVPFLDLSKVYHGPHEPVGYKVCNRGLDLYVIGGEYLLGHGNWNTSVWKYDMLREVWSFETSLMTPRRHHSVCVLGDNIYIIGGVVRHRICSNTVEIYNVISKSWRRCAKLPYKLYSAACCVYNAQIFVFGPQVCMYEPSIDFWYRIKSVNIGCNCAMPYKAAVYLTAIYSRELIKFTPPSASDSGRSHFETVGCFHNNASNTCIISDIIYCFSTDNCDNLECIEMYSIEQGLFKILWHSNTNEDVWDLTNFSSKHCKGCFPVIMY